MAEFEPGCRPRVLADSPDEFPDFVDAALGDSFDVVVSHTFGDSRRAFETPIDLVVIDKVTQDRDGLSDPLSISEAYHGKPIVLVTPENFSCLQIRSHRQKNIRLLRPTNISRLPNIITGLSNRHGVITSISR